ncbi:hypothetical protein [Micromonospora sp. NPDC047074]|uniref:hypothetical protein n=1 Tax=Micromonospora sp. NPDC047074 TaxID=3154339 RepID=UPI003410A446
MPFNQDDGRERAMVAALNLEQPPDRARHGYDAHLDLDSGGRLHRLLFECKSAPHNKDFGTGRDTGLRQLQRWADMHFVFGWFEPRDNQPQRLWYGSPGMMRAWNDREQAYLIPDLELLHYVPATIDSEAVTHILGDKDVYTYEELRVLLKAQWDADQISGRPNLYLENADIRRGRRAADCLYSREVAEFAVRERVHYLLARGGTVNNRKITARYVKENCVEIVGPRWSANFYAAVEEAWAEENGWG